MNRYEKDIKMLTVEEVKDILKIGKNRTYDIFAREDFPSIAIGRKLVVEEGAFKRWLQEKRKKA